MMQTLESQKYEIILVNNDPSGTTLDSLVRKIQSEFNGQPCPRTTLVDCPFSGLSHARNAGLSESLGDLVVFIDDDAMAKSDCLQHLADAYATIPNLGVIGGRSRFNSSDPRPEIRRPDLERLRSQVSTNDTNCKEVKNWWEFPSAPLWGASRRALFDMGGFRCNFGRCGCDLRGGDGDEIVAGLQARNLGYSVWIEPRAEVLHEVDNQRDTRQQIEQAITSDLMLGYQLQTGLYLTEESTLVSSSRNDIYYLSARLAHFAKRLFLRSGAQASTEREYALARAKGRVLVLRKLSDILLFEPKP